MDKKTQIKRIEERAENIAIALRDEIIRVANDYRFGKISVSISIVNGGIGSTEVMSGRSLEA